VGHEQDVHEINWASDAELVGSHSALPKTAVS